MVDIFGLLTGGGQDPYNPAPPMPGFNPEATMQPGQRPQNVLEALSRSLAPVSVNQGPLPLPALDQVDAGVMQAPQPDVAAAPRVERSQRDRRSILDIIGGIADTVATVGGAPALYQPSLDAQEARQMMRADRDMAIEDRARGIDLDGLNRKLLEQRLSAGDIEINESQREMLGQAAGGLRSAFTKYGPEGVSRAWTLISQQLQIPPERMQEIGAALAERPEETITALERALTAPEDSSEFGLQPFYARDGEGNLRAYQLGKDGSIKQVDIPAGFEPAPPTRTVDTGDAQVIVDSRTGRPTRIMPVSGGPATGERPIVDGQGRVIGYAPVGGSDLEYERGSGAREKIDTFRGLEQTLVSNAASLNIMSDALDRIAESGAVYTQDQGIAGRAGAFAQQNLPFVEQVFNPEATTARTDIQSAGMDAIMSLRPLIQQAQGSGVTMSSRMMDTPRELELQLQTVINATDEDSARTALQRFSERYNESLAYVRSELARLQGPQQRRSQQPAGGAPSVTNW
jgi:hypothetical protein